MFTSTQHEFILLIKVNCQQIDIPVLKDFSMFVFQERIVYEKVGDYPAPSFFDVNYETGVITTSKNLFPRPPDGSNYVVNNDLLLKY